MLEHYGDALFMLTAEMAPYLLLGFLMAGILRVFVPRAVYARHLAPDTLASVAKAAAIGVPLPLCSCGVIPTAVGLRKEGASHGACTSFLIATPQTGVDSIVATYSLMGLPFAAVRPLAALCTALFGGWLVNRYARGGGDRPDTVAPAPAGADGAACCDTAARPVPFGQKVAAALDYAFVEMMQDVGKWLLIGLLVAALITVAVPGEWLAALHSYKLLNMLVVLAVAIPMYVCATGSIPIAVSLMAKGLTPGAALVLLMAGPAVNSASMLVIGKVFGRRTLQLYLLAIVAGAILFGLGIDNLLPQEWFAVRSGIAAGAHCHAEASPMDWVWTVLLAVLMGHAFWRHIRGASAPAGRHDDAVRYRIGGMSCNHCKANVERAIRSVEGVESVEVDLATGTAVVRGAHDAATLVERVAGYGYEAAPAARDTD